MDRSIDESKETVKDLAFDLEARTGEHGSKNNWMWRPGLWYFPIRPKYRITKFAHDFKPGRSTISYRYYRYTKIHLCGGVDELSLPTTKIRLVARYSSVLDSQTGDRLPRLLILLICKFLHSSYVQPFGKLEDRYSDWWKQNTTTPGSKTGSNSGRRQWDSAPAKSRSGTFLVFGRVYRR
jgi:hypothetical protein